MKIIFTVLLALVYLNATAQTDTIPKVNGVYEYQEIVTLDTSFHKDELFRNAKVYFVDTYKSANDVIQYSDKDEGKIIGKGFFTVTGSQPYNLMYSYNITWDVNFTTEITCKNGKYRYRIYNMSIKETKEYADNSSHREDVAIDNSMLYAKKKSERYLPVMFKEVTTGFNQNISVIKSYMSKKAVSNDNF